MARVLIFDSGVGGLSVLSELNKMSPDVGIIYVADSGFYPYGDRSNLELVQRLPDLLSRLCDRYVPDVVVIACNTASTIALEEIRKALSVPVVGTVPAIKPAALRTQTGVIGLLGTPGTVERLYTEELIESYATDIHVIRYGSLELVDLAERKLRGEQLNFTGLKAILANLTNAERGHEMDTLVLACTHFPLIRDEIAYLLSPDITIIDSGEAVARRTLNRLGLASLTAPNSAETLADIAVFTSADETREALNLTLNPALKLAGIESTEIFEFQPT